jgi:hypothetical protein
VVGGFGARIEGDLVVASGTTLYVEVAGNGGIGDQVTGLGGAGGFNGGADGGDRTIQVPVPAAGGGGGASDLRGIPRTDPPTLSTRLFVAAGGGGAGTGGNGGAAGANGTLGGVVTDAGGGAGTSTGGGIGGLGTSSGTDGSFGTGGTGGGPIDGPGGGGGGGLWGGGGGAGGLFSGSGAGGGGGSSLSIAPMTLDDTGIPSVSITYTPASGGGGSDTGTVAAQVTVPAAAACLELSTNAIDFGTLALGAEDQPATPAVTVTNCSTASETILASGTDATASGAAWALVGGSATCADSLGLDAYRLGLQGSAATVGLSTTNTSLGTLAAGATGSHTARIFTACPGSSGAGAVMGLSIVFLATP